ncbi:unnamed protein product [Symbiodinium sp. CCMP2592]|nr:unnamed protein product [Symbiodinium sp. CCMP2592]
MAKHSFAFVSHVHLFYAQLFVTEGLVCQSALCHVVLCELLVTKAAILDKESELKYQMDEAGVALLIQLMAYRNGFDCIRVFAGIDETKAEVRKALKDELPLDYSADAVHSVGL